MNKNFYDMVKNWTISDYKTPGIKAEVVLDMLISEFIETLLSFKFETYEVTLLTKEFPIDIGKGNLNAKVDYLVCVDRTKLVMVELKTTNESYDELQEERMQENAKKSASELIGFYKKIAKLETLSGSAKTKYEYSLKMYERNLDRVYGPGPKEKKFSEVDYMYILLTDDENIKDKKLVLTDFCKGGKHYSEFAESIVKYHRELWDMVSDILLICAHRFDGIDDVKRDALEKFQGLKQDEKFFELIRFMCELTDIARYQGLLAIEGAVIPPELALSEFIFQAREGLLMALSPDEFTESLTYQYWVNDFQGENALLGYMTIIAFADIASGKNTRELEQSLVSCLSAESAEEYLKYKATLTN